jgi:hypothetical protein
VTESTPSTTTTTTTTTTTAAATTPTSTVVSVTSSLPSSATANVTVTSANTLDDSTSGKRRSNLPPNRDEEAEAQRKHRSAQARRERRSTQSVTVDDIKAAEQQIKNQPTNSEISSTIIPQPVTNVVEPTLSNNKIGAPSTSSSLNEHDIETERLQRVIEEKKDKSRRPSGGNEVRIKFIFRFLLSSSFFFCFLFSTCFFFFFFFCLFVQLTKISKKTYAFNY